MKDLAKSLTRWTFLRDVFGATFWLLAGVDSQRDNVPWFVFALWVIGWYVSRSKSLALLKSATPVRCAHDCALCAVEHADDRPGWFVVRMPSPGETPIAIRVCRVPEETVSPAIVEAFMPSGSAPDA